MNKLCRLTEVLKVVNAGTSNEIDVDDVFNRLRRHSPCADELSVEPYAVIFSDNMNYLVDFRMALIILSMLPSNEGYLATAQVVTLFQT